MATVRLKGLNRVSKRLKGGQRVTYWYAWKGGPRLKGSPGSPEFTASYMRAVEASRAPNGDTLASLIARYRAAPEFKRLADTTRAERERWLTRILAHRIARLSWAALDDPRVKADLLEWRDAYADRPRTADYGLQVLSALFTWGVGRGLLLRNPVAGAGHLYANDRSDQIWEPSERKAFAQHASRQVDQALRLACLTGLSLSDLISVRGKHVGDVAILYRRAKTSVEIVIPIFDELRELLLELGPRKPDETLLLNTRSRPWTTGGLENRIIKAKRAAGVDKHLHDARGTFATRLRIAGLTAPEIADVLGWDEKRVERILARYVDRNLVVRQLAARLDRNKAGA